MAPSKVSSITHEKQGSISYRKNVTKWLLSFIVFLTCCIFAHFILLVRSNNIHTGHSMKITWESGLDRVEQEKAEELEFWVHRYLGWHKANRHNATRVAVYMGIRGGLGDNVSGMLNMWGYAVTTNRLFLLGMTWPIPLAKMVSKSVKSQFIFTKEDLKRGPLVGRNMHVTGRMRSDPTNLLKGKAPVAALHLAGSDRPEEFALRPPRYQYPGKIPKFSESVKIAITKLLLEPSDELQKLKNEFLTRNGIDDKPYFAFHARLGNGVGEGNNARFSNINYTYISECAADKLWRIAERNAVKSRDLRVFLATDTAEFRTIFENAMLKKSPQSRVIYNANKPKHYLYIRDYQRHAQIQLENIILGDAREIVAFWSGFSNVALWRGKAIKLHEMYYYTCPHRDQS